MAASFYKWLPISVLVYIFSMQGATDQGISLTGYRGGTVTHPHPFHVSTTEINHNATDKTLEIICKIFVDDFESCLSKQYHTKADLTAAGMKTIMDSLVKKYIASHLQIKADSRPATISYLGFEKQDEAANVYLEVDNIASVKKIDVIDSILQDFYDDQINIIHVIIGGNRKSKKLDYPNKEATFEF